MGYPREEMEEMWGRWTAANETAEAGRRIRTNGLGCSWFRYAGDFKWSEQMGLFHVDDAQGVLKKLNRLGLLSDEFKAHQQRYIDGGLTAQSPIAP